MIPRRQDSACAFLRCTRRVDARPVIVLLAALVLACGPEQPPARPDASDGLVVVLPRGESGADLAAIRISDGASAMLTDTPETSKGGVLWLDAVQRLLFTAPVPGNTPAQIRMLLLDPVSGEVRGATDRAADLEQQPATNAAGKHVAYAFAGPGQAGYAHGVKLLQVMSAQDRVVRTPPRSAVFRHPQLAPDDRTVAFEIHRPLAGTDIWLVSDAEPEVKLLEEQRFADSSPRFSRGGGVLYFERRSHAPARRAAAARRLGGGDVCSIHIQTREVQCPWASEDAREFGVVPSPTRDEVVLFVEKDASVELVLSDAQGQARRSLAVVSRSEPRHVSWSPDGERIAYASGPDREAITTVIDREGVVLLETPGDLPAWAPYFASR